MTAFVILLLVVALLVSGALIVDARDDANRGWDRALELERKLAVTQARLDNAHAVLDEAADSLPRLREIRDVLEWEANR